MISWLKLWERYYTGRTWNYRRDSIFLATLVTIIHGTVPPDSVAERALLCVYLGDGLLSGDAILLHQFNKLKMRYEEELLCCSSGRCAAWNWMLGVVQREESLDREGGVRTVGGVLSLLPKSECSDVEAVSVQLW